MQKCMRAKAKDVWAKLIDPFVVLGMTCLLPLLKNTHNLAFFAQKQDVYISNLVIA